MATQEKGLTKEEMDEFDAAWNEKDGDTEESTATAKQEEQGGTEEEETVTEEEDDLELDDTDEEQNSDSDDSVEDGQDDQNDDSNSSRTSEEDYWKQKFKSFEGRYRKEKADWQKRLAELEEKVGSSSGSSKETVEDQQEEDKDFDQFMTDFPELADPIAKMIRKEAEKIVEDRVGTLKKEEIEPLANTARNTEAERHQKAIQDAHPNFQEMISSGQVQSYIDSLPTMYRNEAERVVESGDTNEVIELLNEVKKSTGTPKSKETAKRKTVKPVKRHSQGPPKTKKADPDDFDAAFDEGVEEWRKRNRE